MTVLNLYVGHALLSLRQTRGRGGPGGWIWKATCACRWQSYSASTELAAKREYIEHCTGQTGIRIERVKHWSTKSGETYSNAFDMGVR
jgi:hypothetical protein